jgi:hypothetical protein
MFSLGRSRKASSHSRSESTQLGAYPRPPSLPSTSTSTPRSSNGFSYSPTLPGAQASSNLPRTDTLSASDDLVNDMAPTFASSSSTSHHSHSLYPSHSPQLQPSPPPDLHHPYGSLMSSSVRDNEEDEEVCPVCLCELSLRLQGERPHVVPVCGHRLRRFIPLQLPTTSFELGARSKTTRARTSLSEHTLTSFSPFDFVIAQITTASSEFLQQLYRHHDCAIQELTARSSRRFE